MKITVCVKRVPSTAARIRIGADGRSIDEAGVEFVLNPYDEYAVEEALRICEKTAPPGEATVLCFGPDAVTKELRNCLAMGVHAALHVPAPAGDAAARDPLATAQVIAAAIRGAAGGPPDLILFGRQAVDDDGALVGLMVATLLGLPAVPDVTKLTMGAGAVTVEREVEGAVETYEVPLPCVVTAHKGLNDPRLPNMKGIMAAKKKTITTAAAAAAAPASTIESLELPPERKGGRIVGEGAAAVPELLRLLRQEANAL
ncbi:MAG TPA: electron transfer flavoprotein subunit beta/FixA family protein [Planctomycetota bacterium]|jgi:electron transfer flavoprotein beta subunit|nr:electron transfer flavoprotein subunit beta/FixA family protein [Planctomycetota bacterium]